MLETLSRYWWAMAIRGGAAIVFGILAIIWPEITLYVLVLLFGAYAIVDGLFALGTALFGARGAAGRRGWLIAEGVIGIGAGVITFVWPTITTLALLFMIAFWAVLTGVLEMVAAVRLRREMRGEWLLALSGILSVVFGILLAVWPATGALALVILIGIYAIVFGVALLALALRLRRLRGAGAMPGATRAPA